VPYRSCSVSFVERGQRHAVEVDAETAYEAAVLALKAFSGKRYIKGPSRHAVLELEINRPARMLIQLKVGDVLDWLYEKPGTTADQRERKTRLKNLLADDRH
jgi:hypothetical protein